MDVEMTVNSPVRVDGQPLPFPGVVEGQADGGATPRASDAASPRAPPTPQANSNQLMTMSAQGNSTML